MTSVQFFGAAQTVTGSMHLVKVGDRRILLDCGLYQGKRKEAFEINRHFPLNPHQIDAVLLSHAHIDHSGNLPNLVKNGYRGPIYCTSATRDLAVFLILDSAQIQVSDVAYVNKQRKREGRKPFEPLYRPHDARQAIKQFRTVEYHQPFQPVSGVECTFYDAGHMLGSAGMALDLTTEQGTQRLVFSGDIGRAEIPILRAPETITDATHVIMESTYGDRSHQRTGDATDTLLKLAEETYRNRGKLLIPAFSVGRTQEVVYHLNDLAESNRLPNMHVFVDSPLAASATTVFKSHPECFDDEAFERVLMEEDQDPLGFKNLHYIHKAEHSKQLNRFERPCIIISSSGMCEAGRILHHLKHHIEDEQTTILFSGFQAPNTLGRRILEGEKFVSIFGQDRRVNAKIARLESTSGHADREELLRWAKRLHEHGKIQQVMLVHGELSAATALASALGEMGIERVLIPARGEEVDLHPPHNND